MYLIKNIQHYQVRNILILITQLIFFLNLGIDNRHSYGHDYTAPSDEKKLQHPVYMDGRYAKFT